MISYLDADDALLTDTNGDLRKGEVVTRREHLTRLKKMYEDFWRAQLEYCQARKDQDEQAARY